MRDERIIGGSVRSGNARSSLTRQADGHWAGQTGSLPLLRSLLAREVATAGNSEMSEWYMAVMEDVEREVARERHLIAPVANQDVQEFLNAVATEIFIEGRKRPDVLD